MSSPALEPVYEETTRTLQVIRSVTGTDPVPSNHHGGPDFVPAVLSLTREYKLADAPSCQPWNGEAFTPVSLTVNWTGNPADDATDRYHLVLRPAEGTGTAHWAGTKDSGYRADVPVWVRDASEAFLEEFQARRAA